MRFAAVLLLAAWACSPSESETFLELVDFPQGGRRDIFLNEPLHFKFNLSVDSSSVNFHSIRIQTPSGVMARGRFEISGGGREIFFIPAPILNPSLQDGGYLPHQVYEVHLAGFPRPIGIRSVSGLVMPSGIKSQFAVVDPTNLPPDRKTPFLDEHMSLGFPKLDLQSLSGQVGRPLPLVFSKPLCPYTLVVENLHLSEQGTHGELLPVPIRIQLLENEGFCRISLQVLEKVSSSKIYELWIDPKVVDFSGNSVLPPLVSGRVFPYQVRFQDG